MKDNLVSKGDWSNFLDIDREELLLVTRQHLYKVIFPLSVTWILASVFGFAAYFLYVQIMLSFPLFILSLLLILSISMSISVYTWVFWYFHLYVLTNRKIIEVMYTPLQSHVANDIFLDKVNCTEIDLSSKGFFHELIDMGDLTITFDRPTHQEEFVLQDIKNCDEIGKFLTQKLMGERKQDIGELIWMREKNNVIPRAAL